MRKVLIQASWDDFQSHEYVGQGSFSLYRASEVCHPELLKLCSQLLTIRVLSAFQAARKTISRALDRSVSLSQNIFNC